MKLANNKFLAGFLTIVLVYAVFEVTTDWKHYKSFYFSGTNENKIDTTNIPAESRPVSAKADVDLLSWKRDPFFPFDQKQPVTQKNRKKAPAKMKLKAISKDAANALVMINDAILMEGETIQGYRIEEINSDNVKLSKNGHIEFIYLNTEGR